MDAAHAPEDALAGPDALDEGARLLGERHEDQVAEGVVVDIREAVRERTGQRGRRVLGERRDALPDVPGRNHVGGLAQQAG